MNKFHAFEYMFPHLSHPYHFLMVGVETRFYDREYNSEITTSLQPDGESTLQWSTGRDHWVEFEFTKEGELQRVLIGEDDSQVFYPDICRLARQNDVKIEVVDTYGEVVSNSQEIINEHLENRPDGRKEVDLLSC